MEGVGALSWATFSVALASLLVFLVVMVHQVRLFRHQQRMTHSSRALVRIAQYDDRLVGNQVELKVSASNVGREVAFDVRVDVASVVDFEIKPAPYHPTWILTRGQSLGLTFVANREQLNQASEGAEITAAVVSLSYSTMGLDVVVRNYFEWDGKRFELRRSSEDIA